MYLFKQILLNNPDTCYLMKQNNAPLVNTAVVVIKENDSVVCVQTERSEGRLGVVEAVC